MRLIREHALHRVREDLPLVLAPEVVDHQEPAAIEILAQQCRFVVVEVPLADLDRIQPRIVEHAFVDEPDQAAAVAVDVDARAVDDREPADALHDVEFGVGIVAWPRRRCPRGRSRRRGGCPAQLR